MWNPSRPVSSGGGTGLFFTPMSRSWKTPNRGLPGWDYQRLERPSNPSPRRKPQGRSKTQRRPARRFPSHKPTASHHPKTGSAERILRIESNPIAFATWHRTGTRWQCVAADPPFDWFTRLIHPHIAHSWLVSHRIPFQWLPSHTAGTAHHPAEDRPVDCLNSIAPSGANTAASLNNNTPAHTVSPGGAVSAGPAENGITKPRSLILSGCPEKHQV